MRRLTPWDRPMVEEALNRYLPIIAPGVAGLNADPFFAGAGNVGLVSRDGRALALFARIAENGFDAHLLCDPPWRGKRAVAFGRAAVAHVFTYDGPAVIVACIPRDNRASRRVCRAIGGIPIADTVDFFGRPCVRYVLERGAWEASLAA